MPYNVQAKEQDNYIKTMKQDLLILMMAYPTYITGVERSNDNVYIVMKSGKKIIYDDKRPKSFEQKLASPDLQDMLEQIYPLESIDGLVADKFDPGRMRVYELLHEVYGYGQAQIEKNLKSVAGGMRFNCQNNAADNLNIVIKNLNQLAKVNGKAASDIYPFNGTYNYRIIAGTGRLSPHAFGLAIDLNRDSRDYWQWASLEQGDKRIKGYTKEIPKIFEENNFVWGGKWRHFDVLHYEYRPEIIMKARYFGKQLQKGEQWWSPVPSSDENIKNYIDIIEKAL
ncbi:M15 family metallopeptidase [Clostridium sp. C8-1-8]|uniref:M15 family metallopeptidase n=1 Tax=Clostridium sp. C8-1-8 TaxID=2698831 RepID=UPI001FAC0117|nr:M15 family metallopeptidase [Clostridium sp. C8-1-8]